VVYNVDYVLNEGVDVGAEELFLSALSYASEQNAFEEVRIVLQFPDEFLELWVGSLWSCSAPIEERRIDRGRPLIDVESSAVFLLPSRDPERGR